jgi:hypothetical protein
MTREKKYNQLLPVGRDPKTLTTPEVRAWLTHDLANTEVIRSILIAEIKAVKDGAPRETRTLRGLWYEIVKPLLSRAGLLHKLTSNNKPVTWDGELSEGLVDLVRDGLTSYENLKILDGSRQRQAARSLSAQLIVVSMVGGHYPWVILFTEKDTIWPILESLANLYGVSAISGGGQPSNAATENIVRKIIRSEAYQETQPKEIIVLSLTDYDPAGYSISESQVNQIIEAANGTDPSERGNLKSVKPKRLGLTPDQLTPEEIEANAYEPAKKGLAAWVKETGGINGQPLGLELDSLPLSRLRAMFATEIEAVIDIDRRYNDLREAFIDLMACRQLLPEFEKQREALIDQAKASGAWQSIKEVPLPTNLFSEAAKAGASWIGPNQTLDLFEAYQDQLTDLWDGD